MYIIGLIIIGIIDRDSNDYGLGGALTFLVYTILYMIIFAVFDVNWIDIFNKSLFYTNPKLHIYP
jgi:hypothetical protein